MPEALALEDPFADEEPLVHQDGEPALEPDTVEVNGLLIDAASGEIVGTVQDVPDKPFEVTDIGSAEWVLERIASEEAEVLAISNRLHALSQNLAAMAKEHERRAEYLRFRYGPGLIELAKGELERSKAKGKSWRCAYGTVSFRTTPSANKITEMESAVAWAEEACPAIVRVTKSVTVTDVLKAGAFEDTFPSWLEHTPGGEKATIKTGVGD